MKRVSVLLCLCLLLAGCTVQSMQTEEEASHEEADYSIITAEPLTPGGLADLLEITNARRSEIVKPAPDTSLVEGWNFGELAMPFDVSDIQVNFDWPDPPDGDAYSLEQVQYDMDYIFYFYELAYGPFFHFGGKDAFDSAKQAIMADMAALDEITVSDLQTSMLEHLAFVDDAHFMFHRATSVPMLQGYLSEHAFLMDTEGFTETDSGKRVSSVDGRKDFAEDMVLSITPEGEIAYRFLILAETEPEPVEVVFEDGESLFTAIFSVHAVEGYQKSDEIVSLSYIEDIPVINITSMGFNHAHVDRGANYFLELAEQLRDEPVLIIDLRTNGGGNGILPLEWYERYTGVRPTPNAYELFRLDLYHEFGMERSDDNQDGEYYIPYEVIEYYENPQQVNKSWELSNAAPREIVENDRLLIVLTSKNTGSAAETFTDLAFNVENTLVIGCNTTGMIISSASMSLEMPNTGMIGQFGYDIRVYDKDHLQEGTGFQPDLWVTGDALEAAVALAKQSVAN